MTKKVIAQKSWVSKTLLLRITLVLIALILIIVIFNKYPAVSITFGILGAIVLVMLLYFLYAYYSLSSYGGDLQSKISELITDKIDEDTAGSLLDIGCGSGILSVELAIKCPRLKIQGIDYWGSMWGYSKEKCEQLAKNYDVSDRVNFEKASASSLPFDDEMFDFVISNMVFHEVADVKDKREVIKEALRVLKKGGVFVFQDLFFRKKLYGTPNDLVQYIKNTGAESVYLNRTSEEIKIPILLKTPMFFGDAAMLFGKK